MSTSNRIDTKQSGFIDDDGFLRFLLWWFIFISGLFVSGLAVREGKYIPLLIHNSVTFFIEGKLQTNWPGGVELRGFWFLWKWKNLNIFEYRELGGK